MIFIRGVDYLTATDLYLIH